MHNDPYITPAKTLALPWLHRLVGWAVLWVRGDFSGSRAFYQAVDEARQGNGHPLRYLLCGLGVRLHQSTASWMLLDATRSRRHTRLLQVLLEAGADPNAREHNNYWDYALHRAVRHGCPSQVKLLLDAGANPHLPDGNGYTPLNAAFDTSFVGPGSEGNHRRRMLCAAELWRRAPSLTATRHGDNPLSGLCGGACAPPPPAFRRWLSRLLSHPDASSHVPHAIESFAALVHGIQEYASLHQVQDACIRLSAMVDAGIDFATPLPAGSPFMKTVLRKHAPVAVPLLSILEKAGIPLRVEDGLGDGPWHWLATSEHAYLKDVSAHRPLWEWLDARLPASEALRPNRAGLTPQALADALLSDTLSPEYEACRVNFHGNPPSSTPFLAHLSRKGLTSALPPPEAPSPAAPPRARPRL